MEQLNLFDPPPIPAPSEPSVPAWMLCQHRGAGGITEGGWSLAVTGPYSGFWVHASPACMKPAHLKGRMAV